jgi:hypothetical protein
MGGVKVRRSEEECGDQMTNDLHSGFSRRNAGSTRGTESSGMQTAMQRKAERAFFHVNLQGT